MQAMGLKNHRIWMDEFPATSLGEIPWRLLSIRLLLGTKLSTNSNTFSLRGDQYSTQHIMVYGTPMNSSTSRMIRKNKRILFLISFQKMKQHMQNQLYTMMEELGGMKIPKPAEGTTQNRTSRSRGGEKAAIFLEPFLLMKHSVKIAGLSCKTNKKSRFYI